MTNIKLKGDGREEQSSGWTEPKVGELGFQIMLFDDAKHDYHNSTTPYHQHLLA